MSDTKYKNEHSGKRLYSVSKDEANIKKNTVFQHTFCKYLSTSYLDKIISFLKILAQGCFFAELMGKKVYHHPYLCCYCHHHHAPLSP